MSEVYVPEKFGTRRKKPKWPLFLMMGLVLLGLLGTIAAVYIVKTNEYLVDLSINGENEIILEYGATYDEPGACAEGYGTLLKKEPQALQVQITGQVDVDKLGSYTVDYQASFEDATASGTRTVKVVDTAAPQITLVTDPDHFTFPNQPYEEEGFSATDNYDGDITDKVVAEQIDGKVIYTVADSSGNEFRVEREIRYDDPVAPELALKGDAKITITEGDKWKDPGCTATDNVDGDISDRVTVTGSVDHTKPGSYKLTYEVKDTYENAATAERTVVVKAKPQPEPQPQPQLPNTSGSAGTGSTGSDAAGKVVYLTFDDGPGKHTERLLGVLAKYNVKATFFVCDTGYLHLLDDIAAGGHALALHSKTHKYSQIYASDEAFFEDLNAIRDIVEKYAGVRPTLMRFPGGSSNGVSKKYNVGIMTRLTKAVEEQGFMYFDWNVDSKDAGGAKTKEEVARNVINGISKSRAKNLVVLQHDIHGYSVDAVEEIILWGLANGCTFKALTQSGPICHHGVNN